MRHAYKKACLPNKAEGWTVTSMFSRAVIANEDAFTNNILNIFE